MLLHEEIIAARTIGFVHCGLSAMPSPQNVAELAREFGLRDEPSCYKEIDNAAAHHLVQEVLYRDMAYHAEVMPMARAKELAERFMAQFGPATRYFTNGTWHLPSVAISDRVVQGASWDPVTEATFDTGVLAIGPDRSGCIWFEDED